MSQSSSGTMIKATPKTLKSGKQRGSRFRGVSRNKSKWQVMIMGNFKKMYVGAIVDEIEAARIYDKLAILSHGIQARTNFDYSREEIIDILNDESLLRRL